MVNAGDLMHRWTNGRWKACLHRVACPTACNDHTTAPTISTAATCDSCLSEPPKVSQELLPRQLLPRSMYDERGSDSEFFSSESPDKTFNSASFWSTPMALFDDEDYDTDDGPEPKVPVPVPVLVPVPEPEPEPEPGRAPRIVLPPAAGSGSSTSGGGVDYDALIAAATTDVQRATYTKMKAKAEVHTHTHNHIRKPTIRHTIHPPDM